MQKILITFVFSLSLCASAQASPQTDAIDKGLSACMDKAAGVTYPMRECLGAAAEKMDKRLNDVYRRLLKQLPSRKQALLKEAQRRWLEFRTAEMELAWAVDPNEGGTLQRVNADLAGYEFLKRRVTELEGYLANVAE